MELRTLFVRIKGDTSDLEQKLGRTNSLVDKFKQGVAMGAGFGLFHQATNAIGGVSSAAIKLSADYEQSMNLLQASSGASAAEMEALRETAKSLGSDMSLPGTSAADATVAMLELNKAGLSLNDTMAASRGVLQLSAAAQIDNASAAVMVGDALNTFSLKGSEATRVADLLAGSSLAASGEIGDMSSALQQVGSVAAQANIPIETTMSLISLLAKNGIKGSDAGTSTKTFLQRLQSQTLEAREAMERLGVSIYDNQGRMLSMDNIINQFSTSLSQLSEKDRADALNTIFGADAVRAAGIFFKEGAAGLNTMTEAVTRQGVAAQMAEAQTAGFHGAMDGLKSAAESLAINGLTPILPLLTELIKGAAIVVGWVGEELPIALTAATVALGAYALASTSAAVGTGNLGLAMVLAASQATSAALAFAAIAIPLAGIAVVIGSVIWGLNNQTDAATEQTEQIRKNSDEWQRGKTVLEEYREAQKLATGETRNLGDAQAQELERLIALRDEKLKRATGDGTINWFKSGLDGIGDFFGADVTGRQIAEIQDLDRQIEALTITVDGNTTVMQNSSKASAEVTRLYQSITAAANGTADAFMVTQEEIDEATKMLDRLATQGPQAMSSMTEGAVSFLSAREAAQSEHEDRMEELRKTGDAAALSQQQESFHAQEIAAAQSYAQQQAAQRSHLGQMLIDWINAQAMINEEFAAKSGELIQAISAQYGIVADAGSVSWGQQLNAIRAYVDGATPSLGSLMTTLNQNEEQAIRTQQAMETLTGQYVAELTTKWETGGYGTGPEATDQYRKDLEAIPSRVYTEITAEATAAQSAAERTQAVYDRMDRKIETALEANPTPAQLAAATVDQAFKNLPDEHTTILKVDGSPAVSGAMQTGYDINAGLAAGIAASGYMVSNAMQKTAQSAYMAAKGYLQIQSPSKRFHEIGRFIDEGLALGVAEHSDDPVRAVESMGEKMVSAHERYLDDLDTATQRFAETQAEIWDRYYEDLAEQTEQFNGNKFDDQLDFYDNIANLDSAAREAAMQRQREAWDLSQQMAQEGRAAEAEEYYNAALEEIEADTRRAEKLASIDEDLAEKRQQLAEEQDAARKAALEAEIKELESREQYLKEVDEQRDARAAERLERLRNEESQIAEERDESLSEAQKSYNDTVKDIETRFLDSFNSVREGIGGVADSTESAASTIIAAYNRITAAAQAAASSTASSAAATSSTASSDAIPLGSYALGTGDRGLPGDGLFYGHANEIIANPNQSDAIRESGGIEQVIAKARSYDDIGGQSPQRSGRIATGFNGATSSQTFILEKLADTIIIKDEMDLEVVAAQVVQRIKRRMP